MKILRLRFLLGISLILSRLTLAQGGAPMITDDPISVEKKHFENNLGFIVELSENESVYKVPLVDINYGLSEKIQLKAEIPFIINHEEDNATISGIGKLSLGVKWHFIDQKKTGVDVGTYPQFIFNITSNSPDNGLTDEGNEFFLPLSLQKNFGKYALVSQIGRLFRNADSGEWFYGLLLNRELSERFEIAAEVFGNLPSDFSDNETCLNFGTRVKINKHLRFLLSAGKNVINSASYDKDFIAYLGLQVNL